MNKSPLALLVLLLTACTPGSDSPVTMAPTLACHEAVRCQGVHWQFGINRQAFLWVEGNHLRCQCEGFTTSIFDPPPQISGGMRL